MLSFTTLPLMLVAGALALSVPVDKRQEIICATANGPISVVSAATDGFLGYLSSTLVNGQVVLTQEAAAAMTGSLECGTGPYPTAVENPTPSTYTYFAAAALYNDTLESGSPNWAFLTTSNLGEYVPNAWTDATGVPDVSVRQGIFAAYGVGKATLDVVWQNGPGMEIQVQAYGFVRNDGNLVGLTGDLNEFLTAMADEDQSYTAVSFQMVGTS
ncbi:hypothetical protein CALCODRAFT_519141 [Calocera cornea HHB12733]|uniref:Uncharacterized protein n=1 Tax=Calocera cornea HHB12733 TaxID=1353952 RepID=A0A165EG43_9BASI|nr:hypothetical protein CALCODRAFT_519141 [Calocera cornea HHB12733]